MRVYDGANWIAATSSANISFNSYKYTATSGQTTFSGADDAANTLSYTVDNIIVTLNGITLEGGTDYTATNGTSVVLTSGATVNDELNIVAFNSFTTADMVSATNGGTFGGAVSFSSTVGVTGATTLSSTLDVTGATTVGTFTSTGIDDNATSTAITIDSNQIVKGLWSDNGTANSSSQFVKLTQAQYDAITPDANTIYFIV
jgi:hypothetical protein